MFDMYDSGKTTIDIQKYLHQEGIHPKCGQYIWCSFTTVYPTFFTVDFVKVEAVGLLANRTVFYNPFGGGIR